MAKLGTRNVIQLAILVLIGIFVILKGAIYYPDSYAFLDMRFNRSPLYSTFINLVKNIFGDFYEAAAILIQYLIIALAVNTLVNGISNFFKLPVLHQIILLLIVLSPVVHWHYTANKLLSESLAYPFTLLTLWFAFKFLLRFKTKDIIKSCAFLLLLLLTRGQFIGVAIGLLALFVFRCAQQRETKKLLVAFGSFLLVIALANIFERTYNKVVHDRFVGNQMSYVHLVTADFYVSDASDVSLFYDETEKDYFTRVHNALKEKRLTRNIVLKDSLDDQQQYQWNFVDICNRTVQKEGLELFKEKGFDNYEQHIELNKLCKSVFIKLFKNNLTNRIKLGYKNLKTTYGTAKYLILYIVILLLSLFLYFKKRHKLPLFIFSMSFLMIVNNFLIAFVVHPINRYTFYFDWVIFAILLLLLHYTSKQITNE